MRENTVYKWIVRALSRFCTFFILVSFVISCCTMLFVRVFSESVGIVLTDANIEAAAKITFLNVVLISLLITVFDGVRRKVTVDRPVKLISEATERMVAGDFNVRIPTVSKLFADDKFNEIIRSINSMAEELSGVETLRTDFIASVSHEMKTPLAVMKNYATLLSGDNVTDEERKEYAAALSAQSRRLSDMMTNILKLNKLENQKIFPDIEEYDLGEQLSLCLLQYESIWERRGIEIETDIEDGVIVSADRELLMLVWNNLFSNAFKFTDKGGTVSLILKTEGDYAVVRVGDTGCGMTCEVGEHIFEKFYQGDTSRATEGNGLGLALVKRVVDIMEGEIGVESTVGVGTVFTVKIKRAGHESRENS